MGKIAQVEPNSGLMLPIVARSASGRRETPAPKNSTKRPTTPFWRSISVTVRTRSVAVAPSGSSPESRNPSTCRSEEHTSELQSRQYLVCRLLLEKKKKKKYNQTHNTSQ